MKKILVASVCFLLVRSLIAQSIYSFEGLGELKYQGMPNHIAMGEVGIGSPSFWHINSQNPAYLIYNTFSTFQLGVQGERRVYRGDEVSDSKVSGSLRFLAYAFPVMSGRWTSSVGILPYSTVGYNAFSEKPIESKEGTFIEKTDASGEGGLTHFYWANGFAIKKKVLVGLRANYTFGLIEKDARISILEEFASSLDQGEAPTRTQVGSVVQIVDKESYSDLNFLLGLGYRYALANNRYLNIGATYSLESKMNGTSTISSLRGSTLSAEANSEIRSSKIDRKLPQTLGIGISYQNPNVLTIGLDIENQQWARVELEGNNYTNFNKIALGVNWIPDIENVNSYLKRMQYSLGFNRTRLPYVVKNQFLTDFGINFGISLPVSGASSVDFAFKWGQLGRVSDGVLRENYFSIVLGATINDRWFIKRRYN